MPLPRAPKYPDPENDSQNEINIKLIKIVAQMWRANMELINEVRTLEKEMFELKRFVEGI